MSVEKALDNEYKARRKSGRALLGVSLAPWLNLAIWVVFALVTRRALGHFPHCYWESAPERIWAFFEPLVLTSSILLLFSAPVWYLLFFKRAARWKDGTALRADVVYCMGWAVNLLLAWADPNHFLRWFLD